MRATAESLEAAAEGAVQALREAARAHLEARPRCHATVQPGFEVTRALLDVDVTLVRTTVSTARGPARPPAPHDG